MRGVMRRPVCLIGLAFVLLIRLYLHFCPLPAAELDRIHKSGVILTGQVDKKEYHISKEGSKEQKNLVIYLKSVQLINPQENNLKIEGVICYLQGGQEPRMGSYVRLKGRLYAFDRATNPGEFDAGQYYQILGIQASVQNALILEETETCDEFREGLYRIRTGLSALLDGCFGEKDASILKAVLLGEKSGLDEETKKLYQMNGVIHLFSISGLHISIIGMSFYKVLKKLRCPLIANVILSTAFMYCYGMMTGMSISAFRAVVMFGFHVAAGLFGRTYDMLTAMAAAAVTALVRQPLYLYHSGFLFSFGAILAIGLYLPLVKEHLLCSECKIRAIAGIEKRMSASLAVTIVTLPVYLCFYYEYPLYSLFLNMLLIPGMGVILSDGLISLAATACYPPLGKILSYPAHWMLAFYEFCCTFMLRLPGSRTMPGKPENWQVIAFILILCIVIRCGRKWSRLQFWQWTLFAVICLTLRYRSGIQITFLDVGQGDCIYLADDCGGHYLIDGGSSSKSDVGTYQMIPFLKQEGADTLDAVFVTHMDSDHCNGIHTLVEEMHRSGIAIDNLILPDIGAGSRNGEYEELEELAAEQGIAVQSVHRGEMLRHGSLQLTCLHPEKGAESESNESSLVLYLEYGAFSALFTGDLEGNGEEAVRKQLETILPEGEGLTLLKAAHHGSRNSTGDSFLRTTSPRLAIISAGKNNPYGHPHEELLNRLGEAGCHIFKTAEGGAVTVFASRDGKRVRVRAFLDK